jgi:hypothetical protein
MINTNQKNIEKDTSTIEKTNILTVHRKKTRKLLFQELYSLSMNKFNKESFRESFFDDVFTFIVDENYLNEMHKIISYYENFLIFIIRKYAPKFNVNKMSLSNVLPVYI